MPRNPMPTSVFEMSPDELRKRLAQARPLLAKIRELLPGLVTLSVDERKHSSGRLQHGEPDAMRKLLHAAGKHPEHFTALASKDHGKDPRAFEVEPALADLERIEVVVPFAEEAEELLTAITDSLLELGASAREVVTPVRVITQANSPIDAGLASDAQPGLEFYAARGRAVARTRAAKKPKP